jgi:hypothetical protein
MPNKQPSFSERVSQMHDAAQELKVIAEFIASEAMRMATAQERFSEHRGQKPERRAR